MLSRPVQNFVGIWWQIIICDFCYRIWMTIKIIREMVLWLIMKWKLDLSKLVFCEDFFLYMSVNTVGTNYKRSVGHRRKMLSTYNKHMHTILLRFCCGQIIRFVDYHDAFTHIRQHWIASAGAMSRWSHCIWINTDSPATRQSWHCPNASKCIGQNDRYQSTTKHKPRAYFMRLL